MSIESLSFLFGNVMQSSSKSANFVCKPWAPHSKIEGLRRSIVRPTLAMLGMALMGHAMAAEYSVLVMQALTGPTAFVGTPVRDGMMYAIEESNKNQELGAGNSIKGIVADDASDRVQTLTLVQRHAANPNIVLIMGPTSGAVAVAASNAANDLKIPLMTTTSSMDVLKAGPYSFILTQPPHIAVPYIANYAINKLKVKNCSVIGIHDIEVYVQMQKQFEDAVKAKGVNITTEFIKASDSDFSALATKVVSREPDCIFLSTTAPQGANIVVQLRQAGLDSKTRIMGHTTLTSAQLIERGKTAVEGVYVISDWVMGGRDDASRAFVRDYKARFNTEPDGWNATGYSAMRLAIQAIKAAGPSVTRDSVRAALANSKDIPVVVGNGKYTLNAQRVPDYGMNVLQVTNSQFRLAP